jgi:hypothetical protein
MVLAMAWTKNSHVRISIPKLEALAGNDGKSRNILFPMKFRSPTLALFGLVMAI